MTSGSDASTHGDLASATATVKNRLAGTAKMVMVDLGIPPGFELLSEDFDDYRAKSAGRKSGHLEKFNVTATQRFFTSIRSARVRRLRCTIVCGRSIRFAREPSSRGFTSIISRTEVGCGACRDGGPEATGVQGRREGWPEGRDALDTRATRSAVGHSAHCGALILLCR